MNLTSAQFATSSRFCAAQYCPADAEPGSELCRQHIKLVGLGVPVVLHHITQPNPIDHDTQLYCVRCQEWKLDAEFNKKADQTGRRNRRSECRACDCARRKAYRANPTVKAREAKATRLRKARERAIHRARTQARTT
jgi:hypothetical protein